MTDKIRSIRLEPMLSLQSIDVGNIGYSIEMYLGVVDQSSLRENCFDVFPISEEPTVLELESRYSPRLLT